MIPKNITDAIDAYRDGHAQVAVAVALQQRAESLLIACRAATASRAALEAAIAELVEPPTFSASAIEDLEVGCTAEQIAEAKEQHRIACRQLDRLHDEREVWRSERKELRQRVVDAGKVEPPTDAEVEAWAKEVFSLSIDAGTICAGTPSDVGTENEAFVVHRGELEAGLALMRRARATGSLERLRERVQKSLRDIEANANKFDAMAAVGFGNEVLRWIDEERWAGR